MQSSSAAPKVFISYSHDSQEHRDRILALGNRLRAEGIDCNLDQYETSPSEGWPRWMINQLDWADFVLVICTEQYHRRFRGHEEPDRGRGVSRISKSLGGSISTGSSLRKISLPEL